MSALTNRVILIGNVGIDPEIFTFSSGKKSATISLATHRNFKDAKGELVEETMWHRVMVYGKLTEIVEKFVHKGRKIGIEGRLTYRQYDAADGTKKYVTEVICEQLELLGGGPAIVDHSMEGAYNTGGS